jgi:tetratricopeptide (TPR) repeat protein
LGETLVQAGRWRDALAPLGEAAACLEDVGLWQKRDGLQPLAWTHLALGRWDEARAAADKRLALPDDPRWGDYNRHQGQGVRAACAWFEGNPAEAAREFKAAIRMLGDELIKLARRSGTKGAHASSGGGGDGHGASSDIRDEEMGWYLVDLGLVLGRLDRPDQAQAVFRRAPPHVQHEVQVRLQKRAANGCMWRREGREHARLAWVLEQLDVADPRVVEEYKLALWSFRTTLTAEDDWGRGRRGRRGHGRPREGAEGREMGVSGGRCHAGRQDAGEDCFAEGRLGK